MLLQLDRKKAHILPLYLMFAGALVGCASGPEARVSKGEGPFSPLALNEIAEKDPKGLVRIGRGFERTGDYGRAMRLYGQALANDPQLFEARMAEALLLMRVGDFKAGVERLELIRMDHPENVTVAVELAQGYMFLEQSEEANAVLADYIDQRDVAAGLLSLAGRIADVGGDAARARAYYARAMKKAPTDIGVLADLALSFALDGAYETSVALLQPLMDKAETVREGRRLLALVYALSGQLAAANHIVQSIVDMEAVRRLKPYYGILPKLDRREQAIAVYFERISAETVTDLTAVPQKAKP